ncbi:PHP domain-containing protein [Magnetococcales bacterium HHB-1]
MANLPWNPLFLSTNQPTTTAWEYHAHSTISDGKASLEVMVQQAIQKGIKRLIFTEHTENELICCPNWFTQYQQTLRTLKQKYGHQIQLALGVETPVIDFEGTLYLENVKETEVEFILGAVHTYPGLQWEDMPHLSPEEAIEAEYQALLGLLDNPTIDAVAHPGGMCIHHVTPFPLTHFEQIVIKAVKKGKAIEINPAYHHPIKPFFDLCIKHGALISPGSNAHKPQQLGHAWRRIMAQK